MMYGRVVRSSTAAVLALSIALAGCQTTQTAGNSNVPLTPAEQQLRDEADTFNETVLGGAATGAIIGGILGALAGAASGGKKGNILTGAAIGAAAGGVLGGVDGYITAKAQENSNNKVRMLNAMADDVRKDNEKLTRMVATSNRVLEDSKDRLEQIKADVGAKKMSLAQANAERSKIEENRDLMRKSLETAKEKRDNYKQSADRMRAQGTDTRAMDQQIAQLETQVQTMEKQVDALSQSLQVTRVG